MIALWLFIGLIVGSLGGWMLCALCTMSVHVDQCNKIGRMRYALRVFLDCTGAYHDDPGLARVRNFARGLLEEK